MAKITIDATGDVGQIVTNLRAQLAGELAAKQDALRLLQDKNDTDEAAAQAEIDQFAQYVSDVDTFLASQPQPKPATVA